MADLIISINLEESRKRSRLILETYVGVIPHLKSKQFSGQLKNANLTALAYVDNLSSAELQIVKDTFNDSANTQVSQLQYIYSPLLLPRLQSIIKTGCVFCKNKKTPMYNVERLDLNTDRQHLISFGNFSDVQEKTVLYINYDDKKAGKILESVTALLYIDISSAEYAAELFFDYGNDIVAVKSKEQYLEKGKKYRDYKYEQAVISEIESSNWKWHERSYFTYKGKDISGDMRKLETAGVRLFTNERKKINVLDVATTNSSYGIDWFEFNGEVRAGELTFDLSELIDFRKKRMIWTEYKGQILFMPAELKNLDFSKAKKDGANLKVSTEDILEALEIADFLGKKTFPEFSELTKYQNITLNLPKELFDNLRDYQKIGVKWLLSLHRNGFGGCLADDMGLGKTVQVIAYLSEESQRDTSALIVVPKTLLENWRREFKKFSPDASVSIYHGAGRDFNLAKINRIIITTYGTLLNDIDILTGHKFDHLIVDEAQNVKNPKSKAYRAVAQINATTKIIMTGTPLENNIQEYWGLMKLVNRTRLTLKTISSGLNNEQIIEKLRRLTGPFLLRRFKKDVLADLPEKQEQIVYCQFDDPQAMLYEKMLESIKYEIKRSPERSELKSNSAVLSGLLYLQEICCHPRLLPREYNQNHCTDSTKMEQLMSMLMELYYSEHKIVVFSRFTRMLGIIQTEAAKRNFIIFYLDGNTQNRQKVVDEFEASPAGIFLVSLKAGGTGLNLVSADSAVIYDPWWNPAVEKQAEDRIYRIGQKNKVTIYKLIVANTIEEKIQTLQDKKRKLFDDIVEGHEVPQNITMEDIKNLLADQ